MPLAVLVLIVVLDQILRRIVYAPVRALRETMARAGAGDLAARAAVFRSDEMGELARGFNEMLDRVSGFNQALEDRVAAVTTALDRSHEERIDSYRQMLVLRDALADADRLATIGQTAASVAHQVGTPLNLISGHVQLLLEQRRPRSGPGAAVAFGARADWPGERCRSGVCWNTRAAQERRRQSTSAPCWIRS